MVSINTDIDIDINVTDEEGNPINYTTDEYGDSIDIKVTMKPVSLDQFQAAIRSRHPELTYELEQIRNELDILNGLVKP